ncbi:MAG TPA: hypothetical protein P5307_26940 [Pirellulaceae bacterium]|nr:hypothetical protein [Pirellulaceae bacterium]
MRRQEYFLAFDRYVLRRAKRNGKLRNQKIAQVSAVPMCVGQHVVGVGQRMEPASEAANELLDTRARARSLAGDGLHNRQGVLNSVIKLSDQHVPDLVRLAPLADVAVRFKNYVAATDADKFVAAINQNLRAILCEMHDFARPHSLAFENCKHLGHGDAVLGF